MTLFFFIIRILIRYFLPSVAHTQEPSAFSTVRSVMRVQTGDSNSKPGGAGDDSLGGAGGSGGRGWGGGGGSLEPAGGTTEA
jgi:hypothetical protein